MLAEFVKAGIKCTYVLTNALPFVIKHATKVIIGTSSVLANGDLMSRVGTSVVCMAAYDHKVPVLALCESYKFSEQVRLDSFVWNELGNPTDLVDLSNRAPSEKLPSCFPNTHQEDCGYKVGQLLGFENVASLKVLNLTYDITPAKFITVVACDDGLIPSTLVLSVLRNHLNN
jgi:translation initiation factor eIF-2B subunit delta